MKPSEGGSPKSAVAADAPAAECRVPAPHPLAGCTTPCSCRCCSCARGRPDSGEQRPSRSSRPSRQRGLRDQRRAGLLALAYVLLLGGSLAAAVPARTASRTSPTTTSSPRRYPWTYDSPQSVAAPPPPPARGQQRRPPPPPAPPPDRPRPRPRPTATMPTPQQSPQPAPAAQGRGFSQSSLTGGATGVGQRRRGNGGGAWCASEDAGARAYAATTVFEGKARSRSPAGPGGAYFVTFVVQHVYKDATSGAVGAGAVAAPPLRMRAQVRLQFVEPPSAATPGAGPGPRQPARPRHAAHAKQCEDLSRLAPSPAGPAATAAVRASIRPGGKFVVFADRVGPHNFTVRGAPLARSRATVHAIRAVLCPNCVKPPAVWGLRDISLRAERRLRLVCRTQGTPPPAVMWYKDGTRITPSARVRIQHNRKKSALVIARVRPSDGGRYECKAVSVMGRQDSASAAVSVQEDTRQDNTTTLWPLIGGRCFFEAYCLNGGTCTYYETVGELVCQCAEGYKGQRCENKDVINRGSMYRPLSYFCKLGISNSYYC